MGSNPSANAVGIDGESVLDFNTDRYTAPNTARVGKHDV